jgi:hypothetical protein
LKKRYDTQKRMAGVPSKVAVMPGDEFIAPTTATLADAENSVPQAFGARRKMQ